MSSRPPFSRKIHWEAVDSARRTIRRNPIPLRRFQVILHRTADAGLLYIARAIAELTRYCDAESQQRMWEVHHRGQSLILVTHLERAELYVEQFAARGLLASIEPA